ncbi:MAG: hypothetical protein AB7J35_19075 [Dehalococcoidia bacterium]
MAVFRGKVVSFNATAWTAEVRLDGSPGEVLAPVATNRGIASADMVTGRAVLVDTGETHNPADFVVTAVWN